MDLQGDLLKSELRDGTCIAAWMQKVYASMILEYRLKYPSMPLYM